MVFGSIEGGGISTIATMAMLISVLIIKLTRNPVKESKYSITLAGNRSAKTKQKKKNYINNKV